MSAILWALLHAPSEIVGTPSNFTIFSFCHFIKGYGLADPYEAHGSVDPYELIRAPHMYEAQSKSFFKKKNSKICVMN